MVARTNTKYEADGGTIHKISLSPSFASAAGSPPAGNVNSPIKPKVSKTNREFGLRPRRVIGSRTIGTAPDTFKKYVHVPVLTISAFASATYQLGGTITIGGTTYDIVGRQPEDF